MIQYEILIKEVLDKIEKHLESSTDEEEREDLAKKGEALVYYLHQINKLIKSFQDRSKGFHSKQFIFRRKSYPSHLKKETCKLRKLL